MSDAVGMVGAYAFFFVVYVPVVMAYVSGAFDGVMDYFVPDPGAPNFVKYGEADDY